MRKKSSMFQLVRHSSATCKNFDVFFEASYANQTLFFDIWVESAKSLASSSSLFSSVWQKNWGIWNGNVVEVFLQKKSSSHYEEFIVDFNSCCYWYGTIKPRAINYCPIGIPPIYHVQDNHVHIQWPIEGEAKDYVGNIHACLGDGAYREYFGIKLKATDAPDFHQPEFFVAMSDYVAR